MAAMERNGTDRRVAAAGCDTNQCLKPIAMLFSPLLRLKRASLPSAVLPLG